MENRLGNEGEGFKIAMKTLDLSRPFVSAIAVGMAQRALDEAVKYSKERVTFGKPICKFEALQFMMADMDIKVETARQMYRHAVELMSKKMPFSREAAIKRFSAMRRFSRFLREQIRFSASLYLDIFWDRGKLYKGR